MTHFNTIAHQKWADGRAILAQAVGKAASNSLRNLITMVARWLTTDLVKSPDPSVSPKRVCESRRRPGYGICYY
jgi:hypothetical protein